jgi:hypothetical protein
MFRLPMLAAAAVAFAAPVAARPAAPSVEVVQPWSRPAVAGATAAGYMTLVNHGRRPVALVGAESPLARKAEIHRSSMEAGVMRMAPASSVPIPPGGTVKFAPGGYHMMFLGISRNLRPGDQLPATLHFSDGGRAAVSFRVGSGAEAPPMAAMTHEPRPASAK